MSLNKAQEYLQKYTHIPHIKKKNRIHNVWQAKISRHTREIEDMTHNKGKEQSFKMDTELIQMLQFVNKNTKTFIIIEFHMFRAIQYL